MNLKITIITIVCFAIVSCAPKKNNKTGANPTTFTNPILPGFYPDPSLCRVGDTYYMANSSFEWFPAIPLHKSKDLVNWEPIGHVIDRKNMICKNFNIWAPTIRYHDGLLYVICTERPGVIFFCTATNPEEEWSDPVYFDIDENTVSPIDPSLFWDTDGTCWLASNDRQKTGTNKHWVWIQKVDLQAIERNNRMEASFIGERKYITKGSGIGPDNYTEGPHLFKFKNYYYLMIAEGGTWDNHAVCFLRTKSLDAPVDEWEYHPQNPALTHRDKQSAISATGHADMVETQNGEWWSVHLGVRKQDGKHKLGRETFLVPVKWKEDQSGSYWPYYNPENENMTLMEDKRPNLPWTPVKGWPGRDEFESDKLRPEWNFYYEPDNFDWFTVKNDKLNLQLLPKKATDQGGFAFIARRQQHHNFDAETMVSFDPKSENEVVGLMALIKNTNHIRVEISKLKETTYATLFYVTKKGEQQTGRIEIPDAKQTFVLKLEARGWDFQFYAGTDAKNLIKVGDVQDARIMSSEIAKGFTGSYVGMYGSSNGIASNTKAYFDYFEYKEVK